MLGEIYIASSIAIFVAIYGWSEKIFGLTRKTIDEEQEFCNITNLTYGRYRKLIELLSQPKIINHGEYSKELARLTEGTTLIMTDSTTVDILIDNHKKMKSWQELNKIKKIFFLGLFSFLFIDGTFLVILESALPITSLIVLSQIVLLLGIIIGYFIYGKIYTIENSIQNNLNSIARNIGDKSGR